MSSPAAGAALTGETLAADFGRKTLAARRALAALTKTFRADSRRKDRAASEAALRAYYALLVKLTASRAAGARLPRRSTSEVLAEIERGDVFRAAGIQNFLEADECWYLAGWNRDLEDALRPLVQRVAEYVLPAGPVDVFRKLYLDLFPAGTRHGLGEYYTPDWLAERLLVSTMGRDLGDPQKRVLDPACGSGVFLLRLIHHVRARAEQASMPPAELRASLLASLAGCDVNPVAVLTARANYLLALGDLLDSRRSAIEIPVYSADAVLAPSGKFVHDCDYVVGNPPWVNWESLSEDYRRASLPLWEHYGLFPKRAKAMETILGGAKYDLAMLLTYVAADRYLKHGGKLGFLAPQTLFKSPKAGQGFRRFRLPDGTPIGPLLVEDFAEMRPFGAANRTAAMILEKGKEPDFPVPYHCFRRNAAEPLI